MYMYLFHSNAYIHTYLHVLMHTYTRISMFSYIHTHVSPCSHAALTCPALQAPTNGRVVVSGLVFGSEARYSCDSGYSLEGEASRTCRENGAWSGIPPICQAIQCELLEFPDNGQVVQVGNTLGATGTYSCFPGFLLSGDDIRICQKSGEWSGSAPTCERKTTDDSHTHMPIHVYTALTYHATECMMQP